MKTAKLRGVALRSRRRGRCATGCRSAVFAAWRWGGRPDHASIWGFHQTIDQLGLSTKLLAGVNQQLDALGFVSNRGTLVDATIIAGAGILDVRGGVSPSDPEARFTRKRDKIFFGYKAHLAVDEESGLVRQAEMTPANVDNSRLGEVAIQGDEEGYFTNRAYDSQALREILERRGLVDRARPRGSVSARRAPTLKTHAANSGESRFFTSGDRVERIRGFGLRSKMANRATRRGDSLSIAGSAILPRVNGLASVVEGIILSWGWSRRALAFVSGATGALALPPFSLFPLIAVPLIIAVWLIDGAQERGSGRSIAPASISAAFGAGWWMGFGYFLAGLWWVGSALLVEADKFAWALPLAVVALPAALAVFPATGFVLARLLWSSGPLRIFALAFGLGAAEWARGLLFTGFPWNDLGMALGVNLALAQSASLVGLHGLTFLTIAIFATPATLWRVSESRLTLAPTIIAVFALALIAAFGEFRLMAPHSATLPGVKLRLIQPNVGQDDASFGADSKQAILRRYSDLSERATAPDRSGIRDVTHLIWPESAFPFILSRDPQALSEIVGFLASGATLITGAARREDGNPPRYFNSIEIVGREGLSAERYDKQHLVPFGEYMPFASLLEWAHISQLVDIPGGFESGSGRRILHVPGLPDATPLICYEAIFPTELGSLFTAVERPGWLLNVTDDVWFGLTPGPYQHYAQARLRAIELGLPLVRDANSGISAVLDGFGREIVVAPLGVEGVLDAELPEALAPTLQSRLGSVGAILVGLAFLAAALEGKRRV